MRREGADAGKAWTVILDAKARYYREWLARRMASGSASEAVRAAIEAHALHLGAPAYVAQAEGQEVRP